MCSLPSSLFFWHWFSSHNPLKLWLLFNITVKTKRVHEVQLSPSSCISCSLHSSKLNDVLRIRAAHVSDSLNRAGNSSSSFVSLSLPHSEVCAHFTTCWIGSNPACLRYCCRKSLLPHTLAHTCSHTLETVSLWDISSVPFWVQSASLLNRIQKGIDFKGGLILHSPQKGCKNKRPSVAVWIQPPYHFMKMTPDAFLSVWSQSGCCVWLNRAFGGESTSLMCFNKHDLDCSPVLFWSVEMSLFSIASAGLGPVGKVLAL